MREYGNLVESILSEYESTEETKDLQMIKFRSLELLTVSEYKKIFHIEHIIFLFTAKVY